MTTLASPRKVHPDYPRARYSLRISYTDDMSLVKHALALTIMSDGMPIIYTSQEQPSNGSNDPYNREAIWLSGYNAQSAIYKLLAQANAIRSHTIYKDKRYANYNVR